MAIQRFLIALSVVGLVDAISYMVVAPSIIFYVLELGGTKENYGVILSAFSFASFCAKPFLGRWSDSIGFKLPYSFSLSLSACGGLLYLLASLFTGTVAIVMVLMGRLLGGVGAASSALGYAYLAKVVPNDQQTKVNSLLSMLRIFGMAAGPGVNVFLAKIDCSIERLELNPLNSVGLVLFSMNILALVSIVWLLDEPPKDDATQQSSEAGDEPSAFSLLRTCWCAEILVPIFIIFGFNANFQLIETGFAPATSHSLGWGPVQNSTVLGSISIVIFAVMIIVYQLSNHKVPDQALLVFGLCLSAVGYSLVYLMWVCCGVPAWHFYVPMMVGVSAFPFLGAPTRSLFTKAVDSKPSLAKYGGTMQAVLSMAASVAGFATPGLVARYVLRSPAQVEASRYHRELSPLALFAPCLSLASLVGMLCIACKHKRMATTTDMDVEMDAVHEKTSLMVDRLGEDEQLGPQNGRRHSYPSTFPRSRRYSCHTEARRRESACLMGIPQNSTLYEHIREADE